MCFEIPNLLLERELELLRYPCSQWHYVTSRILRVLTFSLNVNLNFSATPFCNQKVRGNVQVHVQAKGICTSLILSTASQVFEPQIYHRNMASDPWQEGI